MKKLVDLEGALVGGSYRVVEKIADGGMSTVWRAVDEKLERAVALKVIKPSLARSPEFAERFAREAKVLASVLHPSLAIIYSFGVDHGLYFMALELVDGAPLHSVIFESGVLAAGRAVEIAAQVLDGLAAIHERGVVHRDLKPPNILVATRDGRDHAKLVDFGLAKLKRGSGLTDPNVLLGTPIYMSPEQAKGEPVDARSDLYSLACVLYEMLVGAPPFAGSKVHELLEKHARRPPVAPSVRRGGIPPALEAIVLRGLAKNPGARFQTARELATALRSLALPVERAARRRSLPPGFEGALTPLLGEGPIGPLADPTLLS